MSDEPFCQLQRVVLKYHIDKTKRETKEAFNFNIFKSNRFEHQIPENWKHTLKNSIYRDLHL